jgi:hypothetical protein
MFTRRATERITTRAFTFNAIALRRIVGALLIALLLSGVAALPRVVSLGQLVTVDEVNFWYRRTNTYDNGLRNGNYAATLQSGHPGAATMALGTIGLRLPFQVDQQAPSDYLARLARARLPLALVGALAVGVGYLLLRQLFTPLLALLAAGLWAGDLFLLGHTRLLHLDALLTSCMTLAVLALLAVIADRRSQIADYGKSQPSNDHHAASQRESSIFNFQFAIYTVLAGFFTGLALLTKVPSVVLLPFAALVLLVAAPVARSRLALAQRVKWAAPRYLGVLLVAAITFVALWPAMWVMPGEAIARIIGDATTEGFEPHATGNFFLGRYVEDPGPLFYPLVLLFRLGPLTLLGLLILPLAAGRGMPGVRAPRRALLLLALYAVGFTLLMSLSAKKFDRYLLPVFPALDILAAVGLFALFDLAHKRLASLSRLPKQSATTNLQPVLPQAMGVALTLAIAGSLVTWYHPYTMAYFNPLVGGGPVAQRVFLVGWGEGLEQVGALLNQEPEPEQRRVSSSIVAVLRASTRMQVVDVGGSLDPIPQDYPNYLALYSSSVQRGIGDPGAAWMYANATPLYTVTIHGVEYARLYQIPPSVPTPLAVDFGPATHLRGYGLEQTGDQVTLNLFWQARGPTDGDLLVFAHLIGPDGQRYYQADLAPGGEQFPSGRWRAGRFVTTSIPMARPPDAPLGEYQVVIGMYPLDNPQQRIPFTGGAAADPAIAGANALLIGQVDFP